MNGHGWLLLRFKQGFVANVLKIMLAYRCHCQMFLCQTSHVSSTSQHRRSAHCWNSFSERFCPKSLRVFQLYLCKGEKKKKKCVWSSADVLNFAFFLFFLPALLPFFKAMSCSQNPAGINQDSSTSEKVPLVTGLVDVDDRLPGLLGDVALFAPEHTEHRVSQGVVQPLAAGCCRADILVGQGYHAPNPSEEMETVIIMGREAVIPLLLLPVGARGPEVVRTAGLAKQRK